MGYVSDSTYGRLKMVGEDITRSLGGLYVKFWNVYGNEEVGEKSHVITDFIKMAKEGKIKARTDGTEHRQFLHADDCAECMLELAKQYHDINRDEPLHVTSFKWHTIKDIAEIIQDTSDCELRNALRSVSKPLKCGCCWARSIASRLKGDIVVIAPCSV